MTTVDSQFVCILFTAGVRDTKGQSPLDCALKRVYEYDGCVETAHYLMRCGCRGNKERDKLLCGACYWGKLDIVKELVEQDPNGEFVNSTQYTVQMNIHCVKKAPVQMLLLMIVH